MKIEGGYYIKARCIQESAIAHAPPHVREIWDWLIQTAMWREGKSLKKGQLLATYRDIQDGLCWFVGYRKKTYKNTDCENALKWLVKANMVTKTKTTRGLLITVLNYARYQSFENYESQTEDRTKAAMKLQPPAIIEKEINTLKERSKNTEGTHSLSLAPTPKEIAHKFFTDSQIWGHADVICGVVATPAVRKEAAKFVAYWTELDKTGRKQRWELQKTFEVGKRLATWLARSALYSDTKPKHVSDGTVTLRDGSKAKLHFGTWVDADNPNVKIDLGYYPELTKQ